MFFWGLFDHLGNHIFFDNKYDSQRDGQSCKKKVERAKIRKIRIIKDFVPHGCF